jgi:hypothetical protein
MSDLTSSNARERDLTSKIDFIKSTSAAPSNGGLSQDTRVQSTEPTTTTLDLVHPIFASILRSQFPLLYKEV